MAKCSLQGRDPLLMQLLTNALAHCLSLLWLLRNLLCNGSCIYFLQHLQLLQQARFLRVVQVLHAQSAACVALAGEQRLGKALGLAKCVAAL